MTNEVERVAAAIARAELENATPEQIERANAAVEANLVDGQPSFGSAQGYACALTAIMQTDAAMTKDEQ